MKAAENDPMAPMRKFIEENNVVAVDNFLNNPDLMLIELEHKSDAWMKFRKMGIGGSEQRCVQGDDKWKSKLVLFLEKSGYRQSTPANNQFTMMGLMHEETLFNAWCYWQADETSHIDSFFTGQKFRYCEDPDGYVINKRFPYLLNSIDRLILPGQTSPYTGEVIDGYGVLEGKCTRSMVNRQYAHGYDPSHDWQIQQYSMAIGSEYNEIFVMIDGLDHYGAPVWADYDKQQQIITKSYDLWHRILEARPLVQSWKDGHIDDDKIVQELSHLQPDLSDDNPYSLTSFLELEGKVEKEITPMTERMKRASYNYKALKAMEKKLKEMMKKEESTIRIELNNEASWSMEDEEMGRVKLTTRQGSEKLILNVNGVKIDDTIATGALEEMMQSIQR